MDGNECWAYVAENENSCHFSMFVKRKCDLNHCPDKGDFTGDAEIMHGRVLHGITLGKLGKWEERDNEM